MADFFLQVLTSVNKDRKLRAILEPILAQGHLYDLSQISPDTPWTVDFDLVFLPSGVTVVETRVWDPDVDPEPGTGRPMVMVMHNRPGTSNVPAEGIVVHTFIDHPEEIEPGEPDCSRVCRGPVFGFIPGAGSFRGLQHPEHLWPDPYEVSTDVYKNLCGVACAVLMEINRPHTRVVRRTWKDRGERHKAKGYKGAYFNGYTEVVIQDRTVRRTGGPPTDIRKCLHYVRSHRRVYRTGKVVIVPEHWRGDPKLGVKDHRYRVKGNRA